MVALESGGDGLQLCVGTGHWLSEPAQLRDLAKPCSQLAAEPDPVGQLVAVAC